MDQRTFKFRVWNYAKGLMSIPFSLNDALSFNEHPTIKADRHIAMQFTNLLDKNGKEIYEGDILMFKVKSRKDYWEIKWSEKGCWIMERMGVRKSIWGNGSGSDGNHAKDHEISGNIYENPYLIK